MNIFLSGKIDAELGCWRDDILGMQSWDGGQSLPDPRPRWVIYTDWNDPRLKAGIGSDVGIVPWETKKYIVLGHHDYTGPFRQVLREEDESGKWEGYWHGSTAIGCHGQMDERAKALIVHYCRKAIQDSDIVFAFLNSSDCFGSLVEIGYALAVGKFVAVAIASELDCDDMWFPIKCAHRTYYRRDESERQFLRESLVDTISRCASRLHTNPIESDAIRSFQMIKQWSSDPRVRAEADRMLRRAGGKS